MALEMIFGDRAMAHMHVHAPELRRRVASTMQDILSLKNIWRSRREIRQSQYGNREDDVAMALMPVFFFAGILGFFTGVEYNLGPLSPFVFADALTKLFITENVAARIVMLHVVLLMMAFLSMRYLYKNPGVLYISAVIVMFLYAQAAVSISPVYCFFILYPALSLSLVATAFLEGMRFHAHRRNASAWPSAITALMAIVAMAFLLFYLYKVAPEFYRDFMRIYDHVMANGTRIQKERFFNLIAYLILGAFIFVVLVYYFVAQSTYFALASDEHNDPVLCAGVAVWFQLSAFVLLAPIIAYLAHLIAGRQGHEGEAEMLMPDARQESPSSGSPQRRGE